jgi:dihydroxyacetone kinase-like predicted kinase
MTSVLQNMKKCEDISKVASSAANVTLLGARGNSGVIFAQLFITLSKEIGSNDRIFLENLVKIIKKLVMNFIKWL